MNTVKYRALAKDGTWRYGEYPHFAPEMSNTHYPMDVFFNSFLSSFRRETLGQWTSLLDKQGKEIYEGDILKLVYSLDMGQWTKYGETTIRVKWSDFQCGFYPFVNFKDIERTEVIGNIYENKELLK